MLPAFELETGLLAMKVFLKLPGVIDQNGPRTKKLIVGIRSK
jgi:hypothetical protein